MVATAFVVVFVADVVVAVVVVFVDGVVVLVVDVVVVAERQRNLSLAGDSK